MGPPGQAPAPGAILSGFAPSPKIMEPNNSTKMKILEQSPAAVPPDTKAIYSSTSAVRTGDVDGDIGSIIVGNSELANGKTLALKFGARGKGGREPTEKLKEYESRMINGSK